MNVVSEIGNKTIKRARALFYTLAVAATVLRIGCRRRYWRKPVRNVFVRQILFTGYEASRFISLIGFMVGISIVVQAQVWLAALGQKQLLGPILVMVIIRELGPLLTSFVVIGRSGTAIATEMGNMKVNREIHLLDAQGLDPLLYLVLPRALGTAISVFCLTIIFILMSFISGYLSGILLGATTGDPTFFITSVFKAIRPGDVLNLLAKTFIPGLLIGTICCAEGLSVESAVTEVPQATTRAVVKSTTALFIVSALISLLTYV